MDQKIIQQSVSAPTGADLGVSVLDMLLIAARNRWLVLGLTTVATLAAAVISLVMPPVYEAKVVLMPPQQSQSGAAALLSQLGGAAGMLGSATGIKNPSDLYIGMLKSRTVADALAKQFDLRKVYGFDSADRVRRQLAKNTSITSGKDGLIAILVEDEGKQRVASIANAYVDELVRLTKILAVTEAGQRRVFYERQLQNSKDNLAAAELALKKTLDTRGVISVDSDSQAVVLTVARVRAQISAKEIQLNSMRPFLTEANPEFKKAEEELTSLRVELSRLENGRGTTSPMATGPSGLENIKVLRDVKYHQMLYELLAKQYELARLDEARDVSLIQVLDRAIEPEKRSSPKRVLIVLIATAISFVLALAFVLVRDAIARAGRQSGNDEKLAELRNYFHRMK